MNMLTSLNPDHGDYPVSERGEQRLTMTIPCEAFSAMRYTLRVMLYTSVLLAVGVLWPVCAIAFLAGGWRAALHVGAAFSYYVGIGWLVLGLPYVSLLCTSRKKFVIQCLPRRVTISPSHVTVEDAGACPYIAPSEVCTWTDAGVSASELTMGLQRMSFLGEFWPKGIALFINQGRNYMQVFVPLSSDVTGQWRQTLESWGYGRSPEWTLRDCALLFLFTSSACGMAGLALDSILSPALPCGVFGFVVGMCAAPIVAWRRANSSRRARSKR